MPWVDRAGADGGKSVLRRRSATVAPCSVSDFTSTSALSLAKTWNWSLSQHDLRRGVLPISSCQDPDCDPVFGNEGCRGAASIGSLRTAVSNPYFRGESVLLREMPEKFPSRSISCAPKMRGRGHRRNL
jgi:hypothetical protein